MAELMDKTWINPDVAPRIRQDDADDPLVELLDTCATMLNELLEMPLTDLRHRNLAILNLLCAPGLTGSECLNLSSCLARVDRLTAFVRMSIERNLHRFSGDRNYGHCKPMWQMAYLVTLVKRDFGAAYNPRVRDNRIAGVREPLTDSRDLFIHGLLDDDPNRRWGTCASIPVLIAAVARTLGYPVGLAVAGRHIYARWEGGGVCFNIEASNPMGMTVRSDEDYRRKIKMTEMVPDEERSGYYLRTLRTPEEFGLFLAFRTEFLIDAARYDETLFWSARALQFAPDDPRFPYIAHYGLDLAMKHRLWRIHPEQKIPALDDPTAFYFNVGDLLRPEERTLYSTIVGHYLEAKGELAAARESYEDACRHNVHGHNEQRDLQRLLLKHDLPPKTGILLPPRNPCQLRRWTLGCPENQEADTLRQLADQSERNCELLKARDALHDLYLFDPGDAGVFHRMRAMEQRPQFQEQFEMLVEECRRERPIRRVS
jgi:hypothetical protein